MISCRVKTKKIVKVQYLLAGFALVGITIYAGYEREVSMLY